MISRENHPPNVETPPFSRLCLSLFPFHLSAPLFGERGADTRWRAVTEPHTGRRRRSAVLTTVSQQTGHQSERTHSARGGPGSSESSAGDAARTSSSRSSAGAVSSRLSAGPPAGLGAGPRRYQRPAQAAALSPRPRLPVHPRSAHVQGPPAHLQPRRVHGCPEAGPRAAREKQGSRRRREAQTPRALPGPVGGARGAGRGGATPPLAAAGRAVLAAGIAGRRRGPGAATRGAGCGWRRGRHGWWERQRRPDRGAAR